MSSSSPARADDHRDALGLGVATGLELADGLTRLNSIEQQSAYVELDPTIAVGDNGNELVLELRGLDGEINGGGRHLGGALGGAFRFNRGQDRLKTFIDLGLKFDTSPWLDAGPHVSFGALFDFIPLFGAFGNLGASFEVGHGVRVGLEAQVGIVGRSYVL
jgi:hypothetical protein